MRVQFSLLNCGGIQYELTMSSTLRVRGAEERRDEAVGAYTIEPRWWWGWVVEEARTASLLMIVLGIRGGGSGFSVVMGGCLV